LLPLLKGYLPCPVSGVHVSRKVRKFLISNGLLAAKGRLSTRQHLPGSDVKLTSTLPGGGYGLPGSNVKLTSTLPGSDVKLTTTLRGGGGGLTGSDFKSTTTLRGGGGGGGDAGVFGLAGGGGGFGGGDGSTNGLPLFLSGLVRYKN
jgi:hypothetical protein